jgi:uncharacterized OsmC-like protein
MTTEQYGPGAELLMPAQPPRAWAIHAFRSTGQSAVSALPVALAAVGFGVLNLDLDAAEAPPDAPAPQDRDAAAVRMAAETLRARHGPPSLLVGHSGGGPAVLAAAAALSDIRALVTVGSPAPRSGQAARVPLLILHGPRDPVVSVEEATRIFATARHPKSFVALDGIDHAVSAPGHARYVAGLIAAWAQPYLPDPPPAPDAAGPVVVTDDGAGRYSQRITAGHHVLTADEPSSVGGADAGPTPYDLLLAALGACTSMTLRMYADRKGLPLHRTTVRLRHDRVHAKDCAQTDQAVGRLSRIRREIHVEGPLDEQDRARLIEIADRCPVHRTLGSDIAFETTAYDPGHDQGGNERR